MLEIKSREPVFVTFREPRNRFEDRFRTPMELGGPANRVVVPTRKAVNRFLGSLKGAEIRVLAKGFLGKDIETDAKAIVVIKENPRKQTYKSVVLADGSRLRYSM